MPEVAGSTEELDSAVSAHSAGSAVSADSADSADQAVAEKAARGELVLDLVAVDALDVFESALPVLSRVAGALEQVPLSAHLSR